MQCWRAGVSCSTSATASRGRWPSGCQLPPSWCGMQHLAKDPVFALLMVALVPPMPVSTGQAGDQGALTGPSRSAVVGQGRQKGNCQPATTQLPDCLPHWHAWWPASGPWAAQMPNCRAKAPLWANPLLQLEFGADRRTEDWGPPPTADHAKSYEVGLAYMASVPGLHTDKDLVVLSRVANNVDQWINEAAASQAQSTNAQTRVWGLREEAAAELPTQARWDACVSALRHTLHDEGMSPGSY
eukprot:364217-Chlamydomonas_euryale.AAC.2